MLSFLTRNTTIKIAQMTKRSITVVKFTEIRHEYDRICSIKHWKNGKLYFSIEYPRDLKAEDYYKASADNKEKKKESTNDCIDAIDIATLNMASDILVGSTVPDDTSYIDDYGIINKNRDEYVKNTSSTDESVFDGNNDDIDTDCESVFDDNNDSNFD
jgi:hypothetical protein